MSDQQTLDRLEARRREIRARSERRERLAAVLMAGIAADLGVHMATPKLAMIHAEQLMKETDRHLQKELSEVR